MLSIAEIARGTQGALRMLRFDAAAPFQFENTPQSCLRSFRVIALAAPFYAFYVLIHYSKHEATADDWEIVLIEALRFVVDWLFYPVIFYEIARRRGWLSLYPRYIAVLNWINFPAILALVIVAAITSVAPAPLSSLLLIALQGLFWWWFMAATRLVLSVSWPVAGLLLVVNWLPTVFLSLIVNRVLGVVAS